MRSLEEYDCAGSAGDLIGNTAKHQAHKSATAMRFHGNKIGSIGLGIFQNSRGWLPSDNGYSCLLYTSDAADE